MTTTVMGVREFYNRLTMVQTASRLIATNGRATTCDDPNLLEIIGHIPIEDLKYPREYQWSRQLHPVHQAPLTIDQMTRHLGYYLNTHGSGREAGSDGEHMLFSFGPQLIRVRLQDHNYLMETFQPDKVIVGPDYVPYDDRIVRYIKNNKVVATLSH